MFRKAILIIHGFAGGTYDEENLANYLELNRNFDVYQFTLPGHIRNISKVTYQDWINYSEEKLNYLINNGYNNIYLIGHSMGGVIATYLATKYKQVTKLVLAAPAFQSLGYIEHNLDIKKSIIDTPKLIKTYGKEEVIARVLKMSPSAIKEFMTLVKEYYDYPKELRCKVLIIQGDNDNLVPITSSSYVYNSAKGKKTLVYVKGLTHDVFRSKRDSEIFKLVKDFLKNRVREGVVNI